MMRVLVLGGTPAHAGGVEAFSQRAILALRHRTGWNLQHSTTGTAYLSIRTIPGFMAGLGRLLAYRRSKPDVAWVQYVNFADLTYVALAKLLGIRVMVTPHLGVNWRSQRNRLLRGVSRRLLGVADRLALISRTQEQEIDLPPTPPRSDIRNFLSAELLARRLPPPAEADTPLRLVHSGRLSAGKGTFLFVEVCAGLRAAGVPFTAVITGSADEETRRLLADLIERHDLGTVINVAGRVSDEELLAVLENSDVLLHLSRIDSYPLIVLEALALGTYPVCLDLAGARDMVESFVGTIVGDDDPVADALRTLTARDVRDLRIEATEGGRRVREEYSWDSSAGLLEAAIVACVRSK